jgi:hypothetical protein
LAESSDLGDLHRSTSDGEWTCIARAVGDGYVAQVKLMRVEEDVDMDMAKQAVSLSFRHFFGTDPEKVGAGMVPFAESEDEPD